MVTHGTAAVVVEDGEETLVPTRASSNPVDICGAGDSFSAGAALALAVTGSPAAAARFGNLVASITIMKQGTGTASPDGSAARRGRAGSHEDPGDRHRRHQVHAWPSSTAIAWSPRVARHGPRGRPRMDDRPDRRASGATGRRSTASTAAASASAARWISPTQRVVLSTHVGGWTDFDLCRIRRARRFGVPVVMDNDANVGALGEGRTAPAGAAIRCST